MLKNQRNNLQAKPGTPQPIQWVDCHIPHVDTLHPGTRTPAEREAKKSAASSAAPSVQRIKSECEHCSFIGNNILD